MSATSSKRQGTIRRWWALACLGIPVAAACRIGQRHLTPDAQANWSRDSARYVVDSTKWVRDSVVRDSISRTIDTDSLYRLYHRMLVAPDPVPILLLVTCERGRLTWTYGLEPAMAASQRMEDTLWRKAERDAANRMWDRIRNMSVEQMAGLGVSPRKCGWRPPMMPALYNGTDLDAPASRPVAPRRP